MTPWLGRRALLVLLAVAGCASPDPAYYTLRPVAGTAVPSGGGPVKLARPGLAGYLDRPEIVRNSATNRLTLQSGERWGEPVGDMIGRVLAEDMGQRLPGVDGVHRGRVHLRRCGRDGGDGH